MNAHSVKLPWSVSSSLLCAWIFLTPFHAWTSPIGENVVAGAAAFDRSKPGALIVNQSTDKVIINWHDFSIAAGELTKFVQPSATAAALNRVTSGNMSKIYGSLEANGQIFLVNPNGVLIGPSGQINTMSFMASTLAVENQSFLDGKSSMILSGDSKASIVNQGRIQALGGDVFLIAHKVENSGTIVAPDGTVGLAAGSEVILQPAGTDSERIGVLLGTASEPGSTGVNNQGNIQAATAELKAAGGNVYALAINNGGAVRADSIVRENGRIVLKASGGNIANSGTLAAHAGADGGQVILDAGRGAAENPSTVIQTGTIDVAGTEAGSVGGQATLLGDHVGVTGQALIDASGDAGGGTILVGGDFQGSNPDIQNAQATYVGPDAVLKADATGAGDGGRVIVWADQITRFFGKVFARGGAAGGDGGFAEISGHDLLIAHGKVDMRAPHGETGTVLYDPLNIRITGGTLDGSDDPDNNDNILNENSNGHADFDFDGNLDNPFLVYESELEGSTADIVLQARNRIDVSGAFDNNDVLLGADIDLTMQTRNDATEGIDGIDLTGVAGLEFRTQGNGSILIQSGTGGGEAGFAPVTVGKLTTSLGSITINAEGALIVDGDLTTGDAASAGATVTSGGIVLDSANSTVSINANVRTGAATVTEANTGQTGTSGNIMVTALGTISFASTKTIQTGDVSWTGANDSGTDFSTSGDIDITANGNNSITLDGTVKTGDATIVDQGSGGGANDNEVATTGTVTILAGGSVSGAGQVETGLASLTGVEESGDSTGDAVTSGNISITATQGGIGLSGTDAITIGAAQRTGTSLPNLATADEVKAGSIFLTSAGVINNGTGVNPLSLLINPATGDDVTLEQGILEVTTTGVGGNAFITSSEHLILGLVTTAGATPQTIQVGTTGTKNLTVNDTVEVLADDTVTLDAGAGTLTVADADYDIGDGTLTLSGNEVDLTGGADSIKGVGGDLIIQPGTAAGEMEIAGNTIVAALNLSTTDINALDDGFVTITLGRVADAAGAMTISGAAAFPNALTDTLTLVGSSIVFNNAIDATGNAVILTARTGGITDTHSGVDLIATSLSATAETGIDLDTTIGTLTLADVNQTGAINISDSAAGLVVTTATAADGNVTLSTVGGNLDVTTATAAGAGAGVMLTTTTTGSVRVDNVTATDVITINSAAAIEELAVVDLAADLTAASLNLTSVSGIGALDTLEIDTGTVTSATASGPGNIDLEEVTGNLIVAAASTTVGNITVEAPGTLELGNITAQGQLNATAGSHITQTAATVISATGNSTFTTTAAVADSADILLAAGDNNFGLMISIVESVALALRDVAVRNVNALPQNPAIPSDLNDLTLQFPNAALTIPVAGITLKDIGPDTGDLTLLAGGLISQLGTLDVAGTTSLTAGSGNNITLADPNNNFRGAVTVVSGNNVTLRDTDGINLGAATVSGTYDVTADAIDITQLVTANAVDFDTSGAVGGITDTGAGRLSVATTSTLAVQATDNIVLDNTGNDFNGAIQVTSANNVTLVDTDDITLGASTVSGTLDVTADAIDITGFVQANAVGFDGTTGAGNITDTGAGRLQVTTTTILRERTADDITLNNVNNDFQGAVQIVSGNNVTLVDANTITLDASTVTGTLDLTADAIDINGGLVQANAVDFDATTGAGNITDTGLGRLQVATTTTLAAQVTDNIILDNPANDFQGAVSAVSGNNVTLVDANTIILGGGTVSGALDVTADTQISQNNVALYVTGTSTFRVNAAAPDTADILLATADNDFAGGLTLVENTPLSLRDVAVRNVSVSAGSLVIPTDLNDLTLQFPNISVTLPASGITLKTLGPDTGDLDVQAGGLISQLGTLDISGTTTLAAGAGNNIQLTDPNNNFQGPVSITSGNNVMLRDINSIVLGPSTVNGILDVTATAIDIAGGLVSANAVDFDATLGAGDITDTGLGRLQVASTTTLAALATDNITLDNPANDFQGPVTVNNGNNVTLADANTLDLGASTVSGIFDASATDINVVGLLQASQVALSGVSLTLNNGINVGAGQVTLTHSGALTGAGLITAGTLNLNGGGAVGTGVGGRINTLVGSLVLAKTGGNAFVNELDFLNLSGSTGGGSLDVAAGATTTINAALNAAAGSVTLAGAVDGNGLITAGTLNLNGNGNVGSILSRLNTDVGSIVLGKVGGSTFINELNGANLSGTTGGGLLDVTDGGTTTINAPLNALGGTVTLAGAVDGNGLLTAGTLNLNGSGNVGSGGARLNTSAGSIVLGKTSGNSFINELDLVNLSGTTGGGNVDLVAGGTTTINAALNAAAGIVTLAGAVDGNGLLTAGTLNLNGNGNVGALGLRLNTAAGAIVLGKTSGNTFVSELDGVNLSGTTGGGNVDLTDGGTTTINAALNAGVGNVTLAGAVDGNGLLTATTLNLNGAGNVGSGAARLNTSVGSIILGKAGGNSFISEANAVNLSGTTGGGNVDLLAAGTTTINAALNAGPGTVTLAGAVDGNGLLTAGTLNLNGNGNVGALGSRLNTAAGSIVLTKTGGNTFVNELDLVNLSGTTGGGNVDFVAGGTTTINAALNAAAGTVTLAGAVDGTGVLTAGTLNLNGAGNVGSGGSRLNTTVGSIVLGKTGGNSFFNESDAVNLSGTTGGGNVDLAAAGVTTINAALNAAAGTVTLAGAVGGNGLITAGTLGLNGNGNVGTGVARLNTAVSSISFGKTGGNTFVNELDNVNLSGTTGGGLTVSATDFAITGPLNAGGNLVWLQPNATVTTISIGDSAVSGMTLTSTDLNRVTAGLLRIGDTAVANNDILIHGAVMAANVGILSLKTSGTVSDVNAASELKLNQLSIEALGDVTLVTACHDMLQLAVAAPSLAIKLTAGAIPPLVTLDGVTGFPANNQFFLNCGTTPLTFFAQSLASLNVVDIPLHKLSSSTITFDTNVKGDLLENLIGPDSIWLSSLQVEFPTEKDGLADYRVEESSKWTRGILGISGSTQGPQGGK